MKSRTEIREMYSKLTVVELRAEAKHYGVTGLSKARKAELVDHVVDAVVLAQTFDKKPAAQAEASPLSACEHGTAPQNFCQGCNDAKPAYAAQADKVRAIRERVLASQQGTTVTIPTVSNALDSMPKAHAVDTLVRRKADGVLGIVIGHSLDNVGNVRAHVRIGAVEQISPEDHFVSALAPKITDGSVSDVIVFLSLLVDQLIGVGERGLAHDVRGFVNELTAKHPVSPAPQVGDRYRRRAGVYRAGEVMRVTEAIGTRTNGCQHAVHTIIEEDPNDIGTAGLTDCVDLGVLARDYERVQR